eukprot:3184923-Pyramimonas_sp.AAC.2
MIAAASDQSGNRRARRAGVVLVVVVGRPRLPPPSLSARTRLNGPCRLPGQAHPQELYKVNDTR